MTEHDALHRDLGVYVLGGLEPADRDRFERHLAECRPCREELARLAVLPQLLSRLDDAPTVGDAAVSPVEPIVARIAGERRRSRRRSRVLTGTAVATLLVAVVLAVSLPSGRPADVVSGPGGSGPTFVAAAGDASARLEPRPWGMIARIEVEDLDDDLGYAAWAVTESGHRAQLASWSSADEAVALVGSCYLRPQDVAAVEIVGATDDEVLQVLERRG